MAVVHSHRQASIDEIAAEMDRRGTVIEKLEAERNLFKGKYRALLKLINRTRDKLVHVTDHVEDEGDRRYFGSTNDADALRDLYDEMMSWIWDSEDETNRMKSDPYADIRRQRSRAETAEAALAAKDAELAKLREEKERLRIDASNHAADAETVRRERDALIREKERLRNALGRCRTAHCGYNLSGSYEEAAGVVSAFYAELSRIDEVVRAALAGGSDA